MGSLHREAVNHPDGALYREACLECSSKLVSCSEHLLIRKELGRWQRSKGELTEPSSTVAPEEEKLCRVA